MTNPAAVRVGCAHSGNSADAQIAYLVAWKVATVTKVMTDSWWKHATDPTGELTKYDCLVPTAGQVDTDADGVVVGVYSNDGQVAVFEDSALTTHGRGIAALRQTPSLVDPDPIAAEWTDYNGVTVTDRAAVDAMRMYRAVEVTGNNTSWLKSKASTRPPATSSWWPTSGPRTPAAACPRAPCSPTAPTTSLTRPASRTRPWAAGRGCRPS